MNETILTDELVPARMGVVLERMGELASKKLTELSFPNLEALEELTISVEKEADELYPHNYKKQHLHVVEASFKNGAEIMFHLFARSMDFVDLVEIILALGEETVE